MSETKHTATLRPLNDRVILEGISEYETTLSGIYIPDTVKGEKPQKAVVVAVGPGVLNKKGERMPIDLKVGDKVVFSKYGPDEVEIDGHKYLICRADSIMAVIE